MFTLPRPSIEALHAYRDLSSDLSQWAPTVHELVRERITALAEAYGPRNHPTETDEEYAERVLARGQYPFPVGTCLYDDLNSNIAYEHIEVGYDMGDEGGARIAYAGWYPQWAPDRESYERRRAQIYCPAWLVTEPDGVERYRRQTAEMVAAVHQERADLDAKLDARLRASIPALFICTHPSTGICEPDCPNYVPGATTADAA